MTLFQESGLYRFCLYLAAAYGNSALGRWLARFGGWCAGQARESALVCGVRESAVQRVLCREGVLARAWRGSVLCGLMTLLLNLPGWLLHRLYLALPRVFEDSTAAQLVFAMGGETAVAQSWLIMLLWVIPFSHWNNAYTLLGFMLLLLLFYAGAMRRERFRLDVASVGVYPMVMLAAVFLGTVCSYDPSLSKRFLIYHISAALCVLVTVSAVRHGEDLKRLAAGGSVCVFVSSLYGIYQRVQGVEVNASYVDVSLNAGMPGRIYSFFDNPNTFAQVLLLLLPLALALCLCSRHLASRLAAGVTFAAGATAMVMTYSRASWVGFACAIVVLLFLWKPRLLLPFLVLCVLCIPFLPSTVWNRILTIGNFSDTSTTSRVPLYEAALAVIRRSPIFGAGLGIDATQAYIGHYHLYNGYAPFVHAHNIYLEVWLEAGLLGVFGFVTSMLWNIKRAAHAVRHCPNSVARTMACASAAALCGAMVNGMADFLWHYPRVMCIFWFVFAMALASVKVCRAEAR